MVWRLAGTARAAGGSPDRGNDRAKDGASHQRPLCAHERMQHQVSGRQDRVTDRSWFGRIILRRLQGYPTPRTILNVHQQPVFPKSVNHTPPRGVERER